MDVTIIKPQPTKQVKDLCAGEKFIKLIDKTNPSIYIVSYNKDSYFSLETGEQFSMKTFGTTKAYPVTITNIKAVLD